MAGAEPQRHVLAAADEETTRPQQERFHACLTVLEVGYWAMETFAIEEQLQCNYDRRSLFVHSRS
ncbi:hypothetical protein BDA96_04G104200 [Sorghum bicolor]|uniref:Uncharacterized protein n=2 Tax=Sorghum bicolor TaxID=4558 RepID=A0A1Z5RM44_SORBI|nr:hypothetical protein BDA96_04G104200 [Sorghum bicolor]OQU84659.1 hypothetical protein SORBI_3004G096200 [Sorghum bicolor]